MTCISDSLTHYNLLDDPTRTFVAHGQSQMQFGVQVSGGNDAVRFFVSGDLTTKSARSRCRTSRSRVSTRDKIACATSGSIRRRSRQVVPRQPHRRRSARSSTSASAGFTKLDKRFAADRERFDHRALLIGMQNYGFKGPGSAHGHRHRA